MNSAPNSAAAVVTISSPPPPSLQKRGLGGREDGGDKGVTVPSPSVPAISQRFIVPLSDEASASHSQPKSSCGLADWPREMLRCWGTVN